MQSSESSTNPAVQRCIEAGRKAYENARARNQKESEVREAAKDAYEQAMPHLSGAGNIRDFIACVGYAMMRGIIFQPTATKLLYAAQVAIAGDRATTQKSTNPGKKSPVSASPSQPQTGTSGAPAQPEKEAAA